MGDAFSGKSGRAGELVTGALRPASRPGVPRGGRDRCAGCQHPRRPELDADLVAGVAIRVAAARYGLSRSTVHRHKKAHLPPSLVRVTAPRPRLVGPGAPLDLDDLLRQAREVSDAGRETYDRALEGGNPLAISLGARDARAALELCARLLAQAQRIRSASAAGVVDVLRTAEWAELRADLVALIPPGLRAELARRLLAHDERWRRRRGEAGG